VVGIHCHSFCVSWKGSTSIGILVDSITLQAIYYSLKGTAYGSRSCCTCTSATKCISHYFSLSIFCSVMLHFFPGDTSILWWSPLSKTSKRPICMFEGYLNAQPFMATWSYQYHSLLKPVYQQLHQSTFYSFLDIEVFLHEYIIHWPLPLDLAD